MCGLVQPTRSPQKVALSVPPALEVGHDTVDNVGLGSEEVYCVDIAVGWSPFLDVFDICLLVRDEDSGSGGVHEYLAYG